MARAMRPMNRVLIFAAAGEAATGLALVLVPSLIGRLLLGEELNGSAVVVARVAGVALIALGVACLPAMAQIGMLLYSAALTLYLAYLGLSGASSGVLLWPAVAVHAILTMLLARASISRSDKKSRGE
jgi:hypothetical protein